MQRPAAYDLMLRDVCPDDLPVLFAQQADPVANRVAAFAAADPTDRAAFMAKWAKILADPAKVTRAIVVDGTVVGSIMRFLAPWSGEVEVSYWIAREHWGRGIATRALAEFLVQNPQRPLLARAAADNAGSIRVLEKCGFVRCGAERAFAAARGEEIDELVFALHDA